MALERPYVAKQVLGTDFIQFRAAIGFKINHKDILEPFLKKMVSDPSETPKPSLDFFLLAGQLVHVTWSC